MGSKGKRSSTNTLNNKCQQIDIFGNEISLTFKGNHLYKTQVGGFLSLIVVIVILGFASQNVLKLLSRTTQSISSDKRKPNDPQLEVLNLRDTQFMMAFGIADLKEIDPRYGKISVNFVNIKRSTDNER
jgi:hypothetical protein